jgi:hypothetical protein
VAANDRKLEILKKIFEMVKEKLTTGELNEVILASEDKGI